MQLATRNSQLGAGNLSVTFVGLRDAGSGLADRCLVGGAVDPVERITMVFMTQLYPSSTYPIRRQLKTLIYSALTHSNA